MSEEETKERVSRPDLAQTGPIRKGAFFKETAGQKHQRSNPDDAVKESIRTAYEIIKDQVDAGEEFIQGVEDGTYSVADAEDDISDLGKDTLRLTGLAIDIWLILINHYYKPRRGRKPDRESKRGKPVASSGPEISFMSKGRHWVIADFQWVNDPGNDQLFVAGLHARGNPEHPAPPVHFLDNTGKGTHVLVADVPDGQPPGIYQGAIVCGDTNEMCGVLTLTIRPGDQPAANEAD